MTPYEKHTSLPGAGGFLKPGITFEQLDAAAHRPEPAWRPPRKSSEPARCWAGRVGAPPAFSRPQDPATCAGHKLCRSPQYAPRSGPRP